MTPERAAQIRRWYGTMMEFERQCSAFSDLTMAHPESPFLRAISAMAGEYTTAVDLGGDCAWFWLECDLGRSPRVAARPDDDGETRKIETVEDLLWLMEEASDEPL